MKKVILSVSLLLLVGLAAAELQEVQYSIDADQEAARVNTSIYMSCDSSCIGLKWSIPEDAEVLFVRNSRGEIDYDVVDGKIDVPGSQAQGRENETIKIGLRIDREAGEVYDGLYKRQFSIASFDGVRTTGFVHNENLISGRIGFGFDYSFSGDQMRFRGEGPTNVRVKFGEGWESKYFEFFGAEPEDTQSAYEIPIGTLGFRQRFARFPVAVMTDEDYNRSVNRWSDGEYVGGSIKIREPESAKDSFEPVLAHEVVHGLNDRVLNWDETRSSYFDEGTSKYVETLVRKKMYNEGESNRKPAELFGERIEYRLKKNGKTYIYTVPPKGDQDMLWNYYRNDRDFMKNWNAFNSEDAETRSFGYAYSELIIANHVARQDGSVRQIYEDLEVSEEVSDPEWKWQIFSRHMDMTPCKYDDRDRFEQCLEEINSHNFAVYSAKPDNTEPAQIDIDRLEVPNRTEPSGTVPSLDPGNITGGDVKVTGFLDGFIDYLSSLFQDLAALL